MYAMIAQIIEHIAIWGAGLASGGCSYQPKKPQILEKE